jgi:hypothetical protein
LKTIVCVLFLLVTLASCSENYSNGERVGLITQFSRTGMIWKSWEGHLNLTQTGMNSASAVPFDFSIDNDNEPEGLVKTLDSAARFGWKVKLTYHEVAGYNVMKNRGETDHFVTSCEVIDRNPVGSIFNGNGGSVDSSGHRKVPDTVYVLIVSKDRLKY